MPIRLKEALNQSLRMCINQMSGVAADGGWTGHKHHTCSLGPITHSSAMGKYRVLAQSDRSSHGTADWFSPLLVANELRASETLHLPQLHLYISATR